MRFALACLLAAAALLIVAAVLTAIAFKYDDKHRASCEAQGGVYFTPRGQTVCLNPAAIIPMSEATP